MGTGPASLPARALVGVSPRSCSCAWTWAVTLTAPAGASLEAGWAARPKAVPQPGAAAGRKSSKELKWPPLEELFFSKQCLLCDYL